MLTGSPRSRVYETVAATAIERHTFMVRSASTEDITTAGADADEVIGIAMESRTATTGVKKDVTVALPGQEYEVKLGAACELGERLKSDAMGEAIPTAAANDPVAAVALAKGADGDIIPVMIAFCTRSNS